MRSAAAGSRLVCWANIITFCWFSADSPGDICGTGDAIPCCKDTGCIEETFMVGVGDEYMGLTPRDGTA